MFFPPFFSKTKKKRKKKEACNLGYQMNTQKKVSLYEDDDDANDIRVEREREKDDD